MYSAYEGKSLIDSYIKDRSIFLGFLRNTLLQSEVSLSLISCKTTDKQFNIHSLDFLIPIFNKLYQDDGLIDTRSLYLNLIAESINSSAESDKLMELVTKKFETSKKIYQKYSPDFKVGLLSSNCHELYMILWALLLLKYDQNKSFNYLSAALKVSDLLVSLGAKLSLSSENLTLMMYLTEFEISIIKKISLDFCI